MSVINVAKTGAMCGNSGMAKVTVSVNEVLRVSTPAVPITVTVYEPASVEEDVMILHVLVNGGIPAGELSEADAPGGSPETERLTL